MTKSDSAYGEFGERLDSLNSPEYWAKGKTPEFAADVIAHALEDTQPEFRYLIGRMRYPSVSYPISYTSTCARNS